MVTGNPHAFDQGTVGGRLLYQIIQRNLELRNLIIGQIETFPAYKRQRSFLAAGILLDDVSNSVMLYRVEAVKKMEICIVEWRDFKKSRISGTAVYFINKILSFVIGSSHFPWRWEEACKFVWHSHRNFFKFTIP